VRLIRLKDNEKLVGVEQVAETEDDENIDLVEDNSAEQVVTDATPAAGSGEAPADDASKSQDD
jgi:hypothetical protein